MNAGGLLGAVGRRLRPRRVKSYEAVKDSIRGRSGLEVGGPSGFFARHSLLPAYAIAGAIDNVNFNRTTIWEGAIQEGRTFVYDSQHPPGRQYILEATDLGPIPDGRYDFILSSHVIEHVANPLRALREWLRTLKGAGVLVLVVPHRAGTFDHRRPVTSMQHLLDDECDGTGEDDLTHLVEILASHDLSMDPAAGDADAFRARSERNLENRCLHHHVFDTHLVAQMLDRAGLQIEAIEPTLPYHIVAIATKPLPGAVPDNMPFLGAAASYRRNSPFAIDRE